MLKPGWNSASCKSHNISHFFFLCKLNLTGRTQEEEEKKVFFSFYSFFFLWSQRSKMGEEGVRGGRWWGGEEKHSKLPPKKSQIKKSPKKIEHTHTLRKWTPAYELMKKKLKEKKNVNDAGFKGELLLNSARRSFNTVQSFIFLFLFFILGRGGVEWGGERDVKTTTTTTTTTNNKQ